MDATVRRGAVILFLVLSAACGGAAPTSPTGTVQAATPFPPTPPPGPSFPPLEGPSRTFVFNRELSYPVSDYTKKSQFVLYDNGSFILQFPSIGQGGYRGGYREANGLVAFACEGWSPAGVWSATGAFTGNTLTIRYNDIMYLTDFEDAVYVLGP